MSSPLHTCSYCGRMHSPTHLCPTARRVLDALREKGMQFDLEPLEFPEVVPAGLTGQAASVADVLCRQITVTAALVPIGSSQTNLPALIISGRDMDGPLPRWLYAGGPGELRRLAILVKDMAEMAIRRAG